MDDEHPAPLPPLEGIQFEALVALWQYQEAHGWAPTLRELADRLGITSTGHVEYVLGRLEDKGYLARRRDAARCIRLLHRPDPAE